jgi:UPF0176 protein
MPVAVVSFYRFVDVADPVGVCKSLQELCDSKSLLGTVLIASEGVNGTLAGSAEAIREVLDCLRNVLKLTTDIDSRLTEAQEPPFRRMRVRAKNEIVTLGRPDIRPQRHTGAHVSPDEWNRLVSRPETLVIDTRNHYEIEVGTFPGAIDPRTDSFREFPAFAGQLATADRSRPVAMFCTGGIRCEKASALMQDLGFDEVYQLQGGILNYLETVDAKDSLWQGECFVFDTRVAVDRDLAEGAYVQCHACRRPLSSEDISSLHYREGVSCSKCIHDIDADRHARLEERRRQLELARLRGQ